MAEQSRNDQRWEGLRELLQEEKPCADRGGVHTNTHGLSLTGSRGPSLELFPLLLRNVKQPSSTEILNDSGETAEGTAILSKIIAEKSRNDQRCSGLRELLQDVKACNYHIGSDTEIHGRSLTSHRQSSSKHFVLPLRNTTYPISSDCSDMEIHGDTEQLSGYYADLQWTSTKMDPTSNDFWRQRRSLCEKHGAKAASGELLFTKNLLYMNMRNENAWFHRKWVLETFGGWQGELAFCNELLQRDTSNEHSWVQRFFAALKCRIGVTEFDYALEAILKDPENECPWRYLWRLYEQIKKDAEKVEVGVKQADLILMVDKKLDPVFIHTTDARCPFGGELELDFNGMRRMNIMVNHKKYSCAMETLLHLVILGYRPPKLVQSALSDICPSNAKALTPLQQIRSILECTDECRAPCWRFLENEFDDDW